MKIPRCLFLGAALLLAPLGLALLPGCSTPPAERVVAVQTLKTVGESAEAAVSLAGQLYKDGRLTAAQLRTVADFYDGKFQPAFRVAVVAAQANLASVASPDLAALASQLAALVVSFTSNPPQP